MAGSLWKRVLFTLAASNILTSLATAQSVSTNTTSLSNNSNSSSLINDVGALFISPSRDLAFALRIPADKSTQDIYFSMVMAAQVSWAGVGLGSSTMANSPLMLIMYGSSDGKNVTLSPRIAGWGHTEPWHNSDIRIEALPGTGPVNGSGSALVYNGVCRNCRSWATPSGGRNGIDVVSRNQAMIYAAGASGAGIASDDPSCPLRVHTNFGSFTMDMVRATSGTARDGADGTSGTARDGADGTSLAPQVDLDDSTPELVGTVQGGINVSRYREWKGLLHAVIMVLCFVGLLPFGTFVLKLGGWVRAHAAIQGLAAVLVVVGASLGMSIGGLYNRSRNFNSAHQIIGLCVFLFILGQFALGMLHHREYKKTQQKTRFAPFHVWLGRVTILLGVINAFLGFTLSLAAFYNYVLAGLVLFLFPLLAAIVLLKKCISKRMGSGDGADPAKPNGYDLEPWRHPQQDQQQYPPRQPPPPVYQPPGSVGPQQNAREYV